MTANPSTPDHDGIAVIIVNYGTADLTVEAVSSVLDQTPSDKAVEIHVVDNASPGDDADILTRAHADKGWPARVTLWLETENHGFGRGNNVVLNALAKRETPPDKVFFLNPDARLDNDVLSRLSAILDQDTKISVVGASLCRPTLPLTPVSAAFRFPGVLSELATGLGIGPVSRLLRPWAVALPAQQPEGPVDWVSGAAFMARFDALQDVDFFDPAFFLYFEEVDMMWRLHRKGHHCWYEPKARVVHVAGAATGMEGGRARAGAMPGYWYDSWRIFFTKRYGRLGALGLALIRIFSWLINRGVYAVVRRGKAPPAGFGHAFWTHVVLSLLKR